jgi:hypothetical protein
MERHDGVADMGRHVGTANIERHVGVADMGRHVGTADMERHVGTANMERHVGVTDMGRHVGTADMERHVGTANMERHVGIADMGRHVGTADMERHVGVLDMDRQAAVRESDLERRIAQMERCLRGSTITPARRVEECFSCQESSSSSNLRPRNILDGNRSVPFNPNLHAYSNALGSTGIARDFSTAGRTPGGTLSSAGKKIKDPKLFDGSFGKWADYAKYWHRLVRWNEWTEDVALEALHLSLSGDAATYITGLSNTESMNYGELLAALEDRFGPTRTISEEDVEVKEETAR